MQRQDRVAEAVAVLREEGWDWRGTGLFPGWNADLDGGVGLTMEAINHPTTEYKWDRTSETLCDI